MAQTVIYMAQCPACSEFATVGQDCPCGNTRVIDGGTAWAWKPGDNWDPAPNTPVTAKIEGDVDVVPEGRTPPRGSSRGQPDQPES